MAKRVIAVIPARYSSTRLPKKPLLLLGGVPLICRVYQAVLETGLFQDVVVATDSILIMKTIHSIDGKAVMTSEDCPSGTDRVIKAVKDIDTDLVVNVQGDEPFIGREELLSLISAFDDEDVNIASLMTNVNDKAEVVNPNVVKVVVDPNNYALYFSRAPIPYNRDGIEGVTYYKHVGVYAFHKNVLAVYDNLPLGVLENVEKLEQLRWLENGFRIKMVRTHYKGFGIDTKEDLSSAEKLISKN